VAAALLSAQPVRESTFEGKPAVVLSNDKIELTVFTTGGAFTSLLLKDDASRMNPLWEPLRYARETGSGRFGTSVGHFICVDGFGPVSREERAAGLMGHGEAHRLAWETRKSSKDGRTVTLTQFVQLPLVQETLTRTVQLVDGENVIAVESELESLLSFDRPVNWAEHATIGSPFLESIHTVVDTPAWRSLTRPYDKEREGGLPHRYTSGEEFTWPMAPTTSGGRVDVRVVPDNPNSGDHTACTYDPQRKLVWVTALNTKTGHLAGYLFRREEFPWLQLWEYYPPDRRMARGLEFSTQPFDVPRKEAVATAKMFDTPTYRWLPAKSKISARYLLFYTRAPSAMRQVDDVRLEGGRLIIEERKSGLKIELPASASL
jgi:hypothetical protein